MANSGIPDPNSPFGDTTFTKVFVGGLAWETQSETLRRHFEQYGEILEAVVITDKNTRRSRGYGFVTFRNPESARRACADPRPTIDGRRANCNLASLGRPRPISNPGSFIGSMPAPHGAYVGSSSHQNLLPYIYNQPGFCYPTYGYAAFGPDFASYPQIYNPYTGQQFVQFYGGPSPYPMGQPGQPILSGPGYLTFQGYQVPSQPLLPFVPPNVNGALSPVQPSFPPGGGPFPQPPLVMRVPSPQFMQGNGNSDQTTGHIQTSQSQLFGGPSQQTWTRSR